MKKCTLFLMIALIAAVYAATDGEFAKITNAVVFKPLESNFVYYTSSLPILYKEKFDITEEDIIEYANLALPSKCVHHNENRCAQLESKWIEFCTNSSSLDKLCVSAKRELEKCQKCNLDSEAKILRKTKHLMKEELRAATFEMARELDPKNSGARTKRASNFFGRFLNFCCGVALEEQLVPVEDNIDSLSSHYSRLRDAVIENHRDLFSFQQELIGVGQKVADALKTVTRKIDRQSGRTQLNEAIAHQFELLILHYRDITKYCHSSLIPVNVVKPAVLKKDLERMQVELREHNMILAIDADRVNEYYKVPIAYCQLLNDEISILLKVPIKPMNTAYLLFEVIALPFSFQDEICQLRVQKSLLLHERTTDEVRILTGQAVEKCNGVDRLCALVPTIEDENSICLKKVYSLQPTNDIKKSCSFECHVRLGLDGNPEDGVLPIINAINYREYVITRPNGNIFVQYENKTRTQLRWSGDNTGAFHLHLNCASKLIQKLNDSEITLIDSEPPCFSGNTFEEHAKMSRILPSAWCHVSDKVIDYRLEGTDEYRVTKDLIHKHWKREIPTIRVQTDLELEKKLDTVIERRIDDIGTANPMWRRLGITLVVVGIIVLLGLIYWIIVLRGKYAAMKKAVEEARAKYMD